MKRLLFLDNLKVCLTVLVIFHHANLVASDDSWCKESTIKKIKI